MLDTHQPYYDSRLLFAAETLDFSFLGLLTGKGISTSLGIAMEMRDMIVSEIALRISSCASTIGS
jgi:hypothetical protein